jgi:hypothetical protein
MFLMGLFLYKLETTDVDVWLPGPDSEQYMGGQ